MISINSYKTHNITTFLFWMRVRHIPFNNLYSRTSVTLVETLCLFDQGMLYLNTNVAYIADKYTLINFSSNLLSCVVGIHFNKLQVRKRLANSNAQYFINKCVSIKWHLVFFCFFVFFVFCFFVYLFLFMQW